MVGGPPIKASGRHTRVHTFAADYRQIYRDQVSQCERVDRPEWTATERNPDTPHFLYRRSGVSPQDRLLQSALKLFRTLVIMLAVIGLEFSLPSSSPAQQNEHCDPDLRSDPDDPLAYRPRGDRCEGLYSAYMSGGGLDVVSLTESFDFPPGELTQVAWSVPRGTQTTHLRATGLDEYYRMDSVRPAGETSYKWPTNILARLKITKERLGVVGWISYPVAEVTTDVYVPLRIGPQDLPTGSGRYELVLVPQKALDEVYISLAYVDRKSSARKPLVREEPLGWGSYPATRPLRIPLSPVGEPGLYHVQVGASLVGGGLSTTEILLYHPDVEPEGK